LKFCYFDFFVAGNYLEPHILKWFVHFQIVAAGEVLVKFNQGDLPSCRPFDNNQSVKQFLQVCQFILKNWTDFLGVNNSLRLPHQLVIYWLIGGVIGSKPLFIFRLLLLQFLELVQLTPCAKMPSKGFNPQV
jgi:hypothetical protein